MKIIFHIGDYKTGTTWLQKHLFPRLRNISYIGDPNLNREVDKILRQLIETPRDYYCQNRQKEAFNRILDKINPENNRIFISREALSRKDFINGGNTIEILERLKFIFDDLHIVYTVRNQEAMTLSLYSEYVKIGGCKSLRNWLTDPLTCTYLLNRLDHYQNIKNMTRLLQPERLILLSFEDFREDNLSFIVKFCELLDTKVDADYMESIPTPTNIKLKSISVWLLRKINSFIPNHRLNRPIKNHLLVRIINLLMVKRKTKMFDLGSRVLNVSQENEFLSKEKIIAFGFYLRLTELICLFFEKFNYGKKLKLPKALKCKIKNEFFESNQKLFEKFKVDIRRQ